MFGRLVPILILGAAAYWYWTGPYQANKQPDYETLLQQNELNMKRCLRGEAYAAGATGQFGGDPEEICAEQYNLYQHDGEWHSYDHERPEG
jgi:hypothetical protein